MGWQLGGGRGGALFATELWPFLSQANLTDQQRESGNDSEFAKEIHGEGQIGLRIDRKHYDAIRPVLVQWSLSQANGLCKLHLFTGLAHPRKNGAVTYLPHWFFSIGFPTTQEF